MLKDNKCKILAYLRASTDKQEVMHQKYEILEYARNNDLRVDEYIEVTISSTKNSKQRKIDELTKKLSPQDTLVVTELSRLGRSTAEVVNLVNTLIEQQVRIIIIKQNLDFNRYDLNSKVVVTLFSLFGELERDFISLRTKEALASKKASGIKLGKPKGTIQKSKFDGDKDKIIELLSLGVSVRRIANLLNYKNHISLNTYINKRKLFNRKL
uniref:recombinase family protein n=1 Tax=Cardinium endosymbiont of Bemisia tabaci TaxID=672794 RepID=UPI000442CF5A|nr:recombinase family protein [Cardinium endosymbiont of Bemisia tabaci]CDG50400.1 Resolvase [Cardinium endosymbiont cBtQ1 of Bemisia tabaci]